MRTAYEEIIFALSHPSRRQVPSELATAIARKVVEIAETAAFDRAEIVARVFDDIGIRKPDAEQPKRGTH